MTSKTLRLIFPQWQGGNNPPYYLGSQLLSFLSPEAKGPVEIVPVELPTTEPLPGLMASRLSHPSSGNSIMLPH